MDMITFKTKVQLTILKNRYEDETGVPVTLSQILESVVDIVFHDVERN